MQFYVKMDFSIKKDFDFRVVKSYFINLQPFTALIEDLESAKTQVLDKSSIKGVFDAF